MNCWNDVYRHIVEDLWDGNTPVVYKNYRIQIGIHSKANCMRWFIHDSKLHEFVGVVIFYMESDELIPHGFELIDLGISSSPIRVNKAQLFPMSTTLKNHCLQARISRIFKDFIHSWEES